jgi:hypothetical protein
MHVIVKMSFAASNYFVSHSVGIDFRPKLNPMEWQGERTMNNDKQFKDIPHGQIVHHSYEMNMERMNLNPIEIATHLQIMQARFGYSLREMEIMGYGSPAKISQYLKLLSLPETVQTHISNGRLTSSHGEELSKLGTNKLK